MSRDNESGNGERPERVETKAEKKKPRIAPRERRLLPSPLYVAVTLSCLLLIVLLRRLRPIGDEAITNAVTAMLAMLAVVTPVAWFALFSRARPLVRFLPLALLTLGVAGFFGFYRIAHVSGNLVPYFRLRGAVAPDRELTDHRRQVAADRERAEAVQGERQADLATTGPTDFPRFLGPERNGAVDAVRLESDWDTFPPRRKWRQPIGAGWSAFSVVNGYAVTMEQRGDEEMVSCYRVEDGRLVWYHAIEARHETLLGGVGPRATPTIHDGKVYALGATGVLRCLDGASGKPIWDLDLVASYGGSADQDLAVVAWGRAASPLIVDGKVIVPRGGLGSRNTVSLVALDAGDGEKLWEAGTTQISYSSPSLVRIAGSRQIVYVSESDVGGFDPESGERLWTHPWPGSSTGDANNAQALAVGDDRLLLSKAYGVGSELIRVERDADDKWSVSTEWSNGRVLKSKFTNPVIHEEFDVALGLSDGILECVSLRDGRRLWKGGRYGHGQILRVGDLLLVQAESGEIVLVRIDPRELIELHRFQAIEGKTWANPCLAGRFLLVRNSEQAACYELTLRDPASP